MFADDSDVFRRIVAATCFLPDQKTLIIAKLIKIWRPDKRMYAVNKINKIAGFGARASCAHVA